MSPCNVIAQELNSSTIEVAAVDPLSSMQAIQNKALQHIAEEIQEKFKK
jgi:hypothetical protein